MCLQPERLIASWRAGCAVAIGLLVVGSPGCAQVTGLAEYDDAVVGERLFSFESDAELANWSFEGCDHGRAPNVGGQSPGALRLEATTEPCVAAARLAPQREPRQYSHLALWLRAATYDTVTVGIDGVNNRAVICSPRTTIAPSGCSVSPAQGELGDGVLQLVELSDELDTRVNLGVDASADVGTPAANNPMTQLTIVLPPNDGDDVTLYVDDIWLK